MFDLLKAAYSWESPSGWSFLPHNVHNLQIRQPRKLPLHLCILNHESTQHRIRHEGGETGSEAGYKNVVLCASAFFLLMSNTKSCLFVKNNNKIYLL